LEFARAREAGLYCIEWIYELPHEAENPLRSDSGLAELRRLSAEYGVAVRSICADYYMTQPLVSDDAGKNDYVVDHLKWLLGRANLLGATYIVLPFVDSSSLKTEGGRAALVELLREIAPHATAADVELHLETDFPPDVFADILRNIDHPMVRCNYDIGNSASLGFDPRWEVRTLAPWLGSVHVKDRIFRGGTVPLGSGNADLPTAFRMIAEAGFDRWFILQVARSKLGGEVRWSASNRDFVERQVAALSAV
jgi:hexulose-6-phosphate isomerase